mgnify:CR=1 FL=1
MGSKLGNINGVAVALAYTVVNSALAVLIAFGLHLSPAETGAILAFVNNAGVLIAYVAHNSAKRSATVIPAPPIDQSKPPA